MEGNHGRVYPRHDMRGSTRDPTCLPEIDWRDSPTKEEGADTYSCDERTNSVALVTVGDVGVVLAILLEVLEGL
jgi:hypothetical protein